MYRTRFFISVLVVPICISAVHAPEPKTFLITDYGAVSDDGRKLNTEPIAKAIEAAEKVGGGIVKIPGGKWLSGAIELKSRVTLLIDNGATLLMSTNPDDYPVMLTRWEGIECYNYCAFIYATNADHVAITGKGTIEGQGQSWWRWVKSAGPAQRRLREMGETTTDPAKRVFGTTKDALRPNLIEFKHCEDVLVESVNIKNAPMYAVHPLYCERVICRDLYIFSLGPDSDGIDPDSCRNVLIENCTIDCDGDGIALKSGRGVDGRRVDIPCEKITIRDCHLQRGRGGIVVSDESAGTIRNVSGIHNFMRGTTRAIRFRSTHGSGSVEDITMVDTKMTDILETAIDIELHPNPPASRHSDQSTATFRNITFRDLVCDNARQAATLRGIDQSPIENFAIKNAKFKTERGIDLVNLAKSKLENVEMTLSKQVAMVVGDQVSDCTIDRFKVMRAPRAQALFVFNNTPNLTIKNTNAPLRTDLFLWLSGAQSTPVTLIKCDTYNAKRRLQTSDDVPQDTVNDDEN